MFYELETKNPAVPLVNCKKITHLNAFLQVIKTCKCRETNSPQNTHSFVFYSYFSTANSKDNAIWTF